MPPTDLSSQSDEKLVETINAALVSRVSNIDVHLNKMVFGKRTLHLTARGMGEPLVKIVIFGSGHASVQTDLALATSDLNELHVLALIAEFITQTYRW